MEMTAVQKTEQMRNILAFLLVGAFISCLPVFCFKSIPTDNKEIVTYMAGQLSGMATLALGFYFVNKVGQDAADAKRAENTGKMAEAVIAAATGKDPTPAKAAGVDEAAESVAEAAADRAAEIRG